MTGNLRRMGAAMTTATDEAVDLDIDLTRDVPCTMPNAGTCDQPAQWALKLLPCGHARRNSCPDHRADLERFMAKVRADGDGFFCIACRSTVRRVEWRQL